MVGGGTSGYRDHTKENYSTESRVDIEMNIEVMETSIFKATRKSISIHGAQ